MDPIAKLFSLSSKLENLSEEKEKAISGYGYYDWGKSAFETSVTVAILPVWYTYLFLEANGLTTSIGSTTMTADAVWSLVVAISTLSVAIVSPPFGVIADRRLIKKKWLKILTYVGAGATFLLAFAPLFGNASWIWLMVMFLLANVGLNGAGVFYNALLPHLGKEDEMDDISNRAFAYGYLGGGLLLVVHIGLVLGVEADWVIPFCMATAGLWWYGFALFTFMWVPEPPIENEMEKLKFREAARFAVGEVKQTLKDYKAFPTLFLYMLAYFFFIDGINTITALGGVYGVSVLGIGAFGLMLTILAIQFIAAPFAIIFTKIADRIGTKRALFISITGWVVLCFAALAFAPLELESHEDYDILYEWNESEERYTVHVSWSTHELAQKVDYEDEEFDEQAWVKQWSYLLPTENSENQKLDTLEWAWGETEDEPNKVPLDGVANDDISSFLASVDDTRFSASVDGGELTGTASVGVDHPTSLGDGSLDFIPIWARSNIWEPFGLTVFLQFMILGCLMGTLLGGSQGLARSIFGQIVPETRSTEFFGFFGFFNKVAAFMGPMLYFFMTVTYDSRVGIFSIAFLLLIGAGLLYRVDIEAGRADARAEDERLRKILSESS
jgi:UMF1 family MFS transporter